jgi:hypothetical protein
MERLAFRLHPFVSSVIDCLIQALCHTALHDSNGLTPKTKGDPVIYMDSTLGRVSSLDLFRSASPAANLSWLSVLLYYLLQELAGVFQMSHIASRAPAASRALIAL